MQVVSPSRVHPSTEETMLREDVVRELLARLQRGEGFRGLLIALTLRPGPVRNRCYLEFGLLAPGCDPAGLWHPAPRRHTLGGANRP